MTAWGRTPLARWIFDWNLRCTGKVLVGHPVLVGQLRENFNWIPERFIQAIGEPGLKPALGRGGGTGPRAPRTGVWLHGRNWRRLGNRLRSLADRWPGKKARPAGVYRGRQRKAVLVKARPYRLDRGNAA
jgi:hypothetical protein